jgi:anti-anti-sigma factor
LAVVQLSCGESLSIEREDTGLVRLAGDLDARSADLAMSVLGKMVRSGRRLRVDVSQLGRCDPAGFAMLQRLDAIARHRDGSFAVVRPPERVRDALERVGLDSLISF